MPCCGKQRELQRRQSNAVIPSLVVPVPWGQNSRRAEILFEYIGSSQLTIRGLVSGREYTFEKPGSMIEVDNRDHRMMSAVPSVRQL